MACPWSGEHLATPLQSVYTALSHTYNVVLRRGWPLTCSSATSRETPMPETTMMRLSGRAPSTGRSRPPATHILRPQSPHSACLHAEPSRMYACLRHEVARQVLVHCAKSRFTTRTYDARIQDFKEHLRAVGEQLCALQQQIAVAEQQDDAAAKAGGTAAHKGCLQVCAVCKPD